jgi:DNA-binding transcriptional LysR family regulator
MLRYSLVEWKKVTCASPNYFKRFGIPRHPDDLRKHNCLDHYDNRDGSWAYVLNNQTQSISINGNIRVNSSMDLKNLIVAGLGIAYLPSFVVKKELDSGALKSVLTAYQVPPLSMYAVYPTSRFLSKKTKVFLDFLSGLNMVEDKTK